MSTHRAVDVLWSEDDDQTFKRTRDALTGALDELELPHEVLEDTAEIPRLPDTF